MEMSVTLERALEITSRKPLTRRTQLIPLVEASGRVLATELSSKVDDPRFDNSAMDGWAVRESDCMSPGSTLRIVGTSQAGTSETPRVSQGEACSIMTGAPLPEGADAIVMVEDSEIQGNTVTITGPARPGYIRRRGENLEEGQVALESGSVLAAATFSLAATMGHGVVKVVERPRIAVIGVGDELTPPGKPLTDGSIYESNTFGLTSLVSKMGAIPKRYELIYDSIDSLRNTLIDASQTCDAIITSGGVSMGKWDIVRGIMEDEGEIGFWRVLIRPGGPPLFGSWGETPLFGLPGNPVSSLVVFHVLVAPWISKSLGYHEDMGPMLSKKVSVRLEQDVAGAPRKLCLRRIRIRPEKGQLLATTHTHQGSGNMHSMVAHNGLTLLPPDTDGKAGQTIEALWLS
ncbi:MAG: molybdopterin molybdenumtransferase MoeA [Euryarchaeota archaeon]|nr:molybdopterin molybdenumtransferase MoeA [Euryarchaeota archaeon]